MSQPEFPVHLADFDYSDKKKVAEYAMTMQRMQAVDAAWAEIEEKVIALSKIQQEGDRQIAIADLEVLRAAAKDLLREADTATTQFLPEPPSVEPPPAEPA